MWQKPGGRAMRFEATQRFAVDSVAFSWQARFRMAGPIAIRVVDDYADGEGGLEVRVLGIPIRRQTGREIVAGEALRYLAELPWVPYAIVRNRELEWREAGERRVEVATRVGGERLMVELQFDAAGNLTRSSSEMRLLEVEKAWVPAPWAGDFSEYELVGGIRIPTRAEVYWELESGRFVYWRGQVTAVDLLEKPFQGRRGG